MPVRQLTSRFTPRGWLILAGGALAAILVVYLFLHMVSQPSYSTLATGLEPAQTGKMTAALDQQGIGYELQNNGTALAVQSDETARARVALAGAGLLGNTQPGFCCLKNRASAKATFSSRSPISARCRVSSSRRSTTSREFQVPRSSSSCPALRTSCSVKTRTRPPPRCC